MGVLDEVFGGSEGLVNVLAENLGGTVRLIYVHEQDYDEESGNDVMRESYQVLPFVPAKTIGNTNVSYPTGSSYVGRPSSEGEGMIATQTCSGTIPACNVVREPGAGCDRFERIGKTYRITEVKPNIVGDTIVSYDLTGVQV